jgi:hypothetical protein
MIYLKLTTVIDDDLLGGTTATGTETFDGLDNVQTIKKTTMLVFFLSR